MSRSPAPLYSATPKMVRFRTRYHLDEKFRQEVLRKNREKEERGGFRSLRLKQIRKRICDIRINMARWEKKMDAADRELVALVEERERIKQR